jgi:hypothetical protein
MAKFQRLAPYVLTPPREVENQGWGGPCFYFATSLQNWLMPYWQASYSPEGRRIPVQLLATLPWQEWLSWWVMDDGSNQAGCITLYLNRYPKQDVEALQSLLSSYGLQSSLRNHKGFYLGFSREASRTLKLELAPFTIPSMMYKLEGVHSGGKVVQCKVCNSDIQMLDGQQRKREYCQNEICQKVKKYMSYPPAYIVPLQEAKTKALAWGLKYGYSL